MLTTGEIYHDPGGDYFTRRDPDTHRPDASSPNSKRLGHNVTLEEQQVATWTGFSLQRR